MKRLVRGRVPWLAALAAALVAAGAAVAAVVLSGGSSVPRLLPAGHNIFVRGNLSPREALFGDSIRARVDVRFDRRVIDPDRIKVQTNFDPYTRAGPVVTQRRTVGDVIQVTTTTTLRCHTSTCLITGGRRRVRFRAGELRFFRQTGGGVQTRPLRFPLLVVSSRLGLRDVQANPLNPILPQWRAETRDLPQPTYSTTPGIASAVLVAAAALLLLVAAALGYRLLPESIRTFGRRRPPLPPLERALALLESARSRGQEREERKALDLLARELQDRGARDLAGTARELAWSRSSPPETATGELADEVRGMLNGRANGA